MGIITMNQLAPGEGLRPQVEPQLVEYGELKAIKDAGNLIPGQWYRITDYVTTVNGNTEANARSVGHAFDVLVMATDAGTLSEDALAVRHDGDTYFENSRLEAWELKFRLENEKWSKQKGTYVVDEENSYSFFAIGTIELGGHTYQLLQGLGTYVEDWSDYALMDSLEVGETIYCYYGDPEDFDPEEPEEVGTASAVDVVTEEGKGTILWMKDEWGNECPYDFKNIQFKRWKATDAISGREGLNGLYMVAHPDNAAKNLSVDDTEDYIWAYTFSSDNSGGDQTDFSLGGHNVHDNVFKPYGDLLPNNVMFGGDNYGNSFGLNCYYNSWGNSCYYNSWGNDCYNNSWGNYCNNNSWGNNCYNNSWGNSCYYNSWGNSCYYNSWGNDCYNNSWGNDCCYNSWGNGCYRNSWGNYCNNNSWGNVCQNNSWGNSCNSNSWGNYCQNNSWGNGCSSNSWGNYCQNNSWGNDCNNNSWGNDCYYNSWGNSCSRNSWGNGCNSNSWGNDCNNNSWGNVCQYNSWGNGCSSNSWGNSCSSNSWGNSCSRNSWGNDCYSNSWGDEVTHSTVFDGVQYTQITTTKVKFVQVLNGVQGTSSSKLTLTFVANKTYTQVAAKTSAGVLKIYVPGDLA